MTLPRRQLVCLDETPYYHCTSRCVRRAFLCGRDRFSGQDFSHRRKWIENRLRELTGLFAIELLSYAIMDNHYHVVLRVDTAAAAAWTSEEVVSRWSRLYRLPKTYTVAIDEGTRCPRVAAEFIGIWRRRLTELGWFMRAINEPLARMANREDGCSGRFWEGRYRSQALLDTAAVVRCMAYVDLNPIRAGRAKTPETSLFTSIRSRIVGAGQHLARFAQEPGADGIPIGYRDYLQLVDWTGRALRRGKTGAIPQDAPGILERLAADPGNWIAAVERRALFRGLAFGSVHRLRQYRERIKARDQLQVAATA